MSSGVCAGLPCDGRRLYPPIIIDFVPVSSDRIV
jgi:hypothetical protein